jgi:DNA-directed RNA polymerase subunit beta
MTKAKRIRKSFSKLQKALEQPYLLETQRNSYELFLQKDVNPEDRKDVGLQAAFTSVFPIKDFYGTSQIDFVSYEIGEPKYSIEECILKKLTYTSPLRITVRLIAWDIDSETAAKSIRDIKEQKIYFGEIPLMTDNATFIINGIERVIVSQLHRSPGVFFTFDKKDVIARIIPYRGSWIDFEFDTKNCLYVKIDKRKKIPATILFRALGLSSKEILHYFYETEDYIFEDDKIFKVLNYDKERTLLNFKLIEDVIANGEVLIPKNRKVKKNTIKRLKAAGIDKLLATEENIIGKAVADDIVDEETGEIILECNEVITEEKLKYLKECRIKKLNLLSIDNITTLPIIRDTLLIDKISNISKEHKKEYPDKPLKEIEIEAALIMIYKRLRPGEPVDIDTAKNFFHNLFFEKERYSLSRIGRLKFNFKLNQKKPLDNVTLESDDILSVAKYLIEIKNGTPGYEIDDIDNLGNRRVRSVGELAENQFRIGLVRMERAIKEKLSLKDIDSLMPQDIVNHKPVITVLNDFFQSSQLSQFMDQTNPLSEITHKRRLSALGPGGLTRERAGFEVRDVHATHYGRICPIETPEGPNIGLISSMTTYATVNEFGFIETPYRKVKNGKVTDEIVHLSAFEEKGLVIAQANAPIDKKGNFLNDMVLARKDGDFKWVNKGEVQYMDVSPNQVVSVAASLIPFLEHDDANRALMGSNMQRQAVPLLKTEAPLVGTGMESKTARDSGLAILAKRDGTVLKVDKNRIIIKADADSFDNYDIYYIMNNRKSNQNTLYEQKPLVSKGDRVKAGEVIADGPGMEKGELALGKNVLVAFMPWGGYNFEDSILVSENIIKNDVYTSVHIEEFECFARNTKLGDEEITADIPNVGESELKNLDENGIVRVGAYVRPGDILVGKVTPKSETQLTPEEKLLRAIFGEKAKDVTDSSLRVPPGVEGTVVDIKIFSRNKKSNIEVNKYYEKDIKLLEENKNDEIRIVKQSFYKKMVKILNGKELKSELKYDDKLLKKGTVFTEDIIENIPTGVFKDIKVKFDVEEKIGKYKTLYDAKIKEIEGRYHKKIENLGIGDELQPGVFTMIKVFLAIKRKLSVGDKMSGRHGNKGVVSKILPEESMPFLADGTPVDIVLNPLGVPSRMNVGQILETHLGWAAKEVGYKIQQYMEENYSPEILREKIIEYYNDREVTKFVKKLDDDSVVEMAKELGKGLFVATPVFDGASEDEIKKYLKKLDLPGNGQVTLYDGRTGEEFANNVTIGYMYMLKLHHLVDEKIHARSIGPYSLVTQQPLGGKAQFGGQRIGEMEVWALEAYGAAYSLQEFLTVKSDDLAGRNRMYEAIVKGKNFLQSGIPESFNVLINELKGLALDVKLIEYDDQE